jgi:hypothetical protein
MLQLLAIIFPGKNVANDGNVKMFIKTFKTFIIVYALIDESLIIMESFPLY